MSFNKLLKAMKSNQVLVITIAVIIAFFIMRSMHKRENTENTDDADDDADAGSCVEQQAEIATIQKWDPETGELTDMDISEKNAKEVCEAMAQRVAEIETAMANTSDRNTGETFMDVFENITSFLNPESYSGDQRSVAMLTNIVNTNLSSEDRAAINSACGNVNTAVQINELSPGDCPYCLINGCNLTNITQENISTSKQTCGMAVAIEKLRNKKNNLDAQALAEVLQKKEGALSGNQSSLTSNCSVMNSDMSSSDFLNVSNCCSNVNKVDQTNRINKTCGSLTNIIQRNVAENVQQCLIDQNMMSSSSTESKQSLLSSLKTKMDSVGITGGASAASSFSSVLSIGIAGYVFLNQPK